MKNDYAQITDISFLSSAGKEKSVYQKLFSDGLFSDALKWKDFNVSKDIPGLLDAINVRMKYFMSKMSLCVYNVLENGPSKNISKEDEVYLFSGFTEIGTVSKIGDLIMENNYSINPSLFPNSVHHISLCYFMILKKLTNYCAAVTDGLTTNLSFINFIKNRIKLENDFIVVSGEEDASYFSYEKNNELDIQPVFVSYKVKPGNGSGFKYQGVFKNINEIISSELFKNSENIFSDKDSFVLLKNSGKKIYSEYPLVKDNPCGITYRLAFPFYYDIKGRSIVVEKYLEKFYVFEVVI